MAKIPQTCQNTLRYIFSSLIGIIALINIFVITQLYQISIVSQNTKLTATPLPSSTSSSTDKLTIATTQDNILYFNPIQHSQCKNAIINKEQIDISSLAINAGSSINISDVIWTREYINFINDTINKHPFISLGAQVRFPWNYERNKPSKQELTEHGIDVPIYYMLPKSGSSSVFSSLGRYFGPEWKGSSINYNVKALDDHNHIHSNCGYTFVRNPIDRFISGYYTIQSKLYVIGKEDTFQNASTRYSKWTQQYGFKFFYEMKEPKRFITFVDDMINNAYLFSAHSPFAHIRSQSSLLYNIFYESDIGFFGRTEHFDQHWEVLMKHCDWFQQHIDGSRKVSQREKHQMKGYGTNYVEKYAEYGNVMGLLENEKQNKSLSPAYYIVANNESLYNSLVDYFWQDFVCFGYKPDFEKFKRYVNNK